MATSTLTVPYSIDEPNDLLKLDAVSSLELPHNEKSQCEATVNGSPSDLLIVSPYTSRSHLFDLNSVDKANQLLSTALTVLKAVRPDYATAPYISAFNWSEVLERLKLSLKANAGYQWKEQFFYIVVFRSQIPPSTDRSHLDSLDEAAHAEAMKSGGLLKYWFGEPDENGRNLATCVWRELEDAKRGSQGEGHRQAVRSTSKLYTEWKVERLRLSIGENAQHLEITDWID